MELEEGGVRGPIVNLWLIVAGPAVALGGGCVEEGGFLRWD